MYIKIRKLGAKPGEDQLLLNLPKSTKIEELRTRISSEWMVNAKDQKLLYKGKLLSDNHALFEYKMQLNDVIQLMICKESEKTDAHITSANDLTLDSDNQSKFYKIGDKVDLQDESGAWFETIIERIVTNCGKFEANRREREAHLIFRCIQDNICYPIRVDCMFDSIRPRSYHIYELPDLRPGMKVLINYNIDEPLERGYWYDFQITAKHTTHLKGSLLLGSDVVPLKNIKITNLNEIYRIETATKTDKQLTRQIQARKMPIHCISCKDNLSATCPDCGCNICQRKDNVELLLVCHDCDNAFHMSCLVPPLQSSPESNEWYCSKCKVNANEIITPDCELIVRYKRSNMPCATNKSSRWGEGMSCVGRTKEITVTRKDHLGPVPGIEVGTRWLYRQQVSEAGIHRPLVAGIHGSERHGAYSIILSGGYEDDIDNGDEFFYTGSGGRDLSGNKRAADQNGDQTLSRMNKALAMSCNAAFNNQIGAEAEDWKGGTPIRVVRNYKASKHSKYAPKEGNRYDGIYKLVKYYPQRGKSGFTIWRYLLRRDDPVPAPWHENGKEYDVIYPDGYAEMQKQKAMKQKGAKINRKSSQIIVTSKRRAEDDLQNYKKHMKSEGFEIPPELRKMIEEDEVNWKLWAECKTTANFGKIKFFDMVQEMFMCVCCQDLVYMPVTTVCSHNICKMCLQRSFEAEIVTCPHCRYELAENYDMQVNENLRKVLNFMFPQYEDSRH